MRRGLFERFEQRVERRVGYLVRLVDDVYFYLLEEAGANFTLSLKDLISSIPRLEAPSISSTSTLDPEVISRQFGHFPHGSGVEFFWALPV